MQFPQTCRDRCIVLRRAIVQADVVEPGWRLVALDPQARVGEIAQQSPIACAIASTHATDEIRQVIGADSLGFLSRQGMLDAVGGRTEARCTACFDGVYPTDVPLELDKLAMERR